MIVDAPTNSLMTGALKSDADPTWHMTWQVSFANKTIETALHRAGATTTNFAQPPGLGADLARSRTCR
jgi:hypothetical protein